MAASGGQLPNIKPWCRGIHPRLLKQCSSENATAPPAWTPDSYIDMSVAVMSTPLTPSPTPSPPLEDPCPKLEPRFSLPSTTPRSSKDTLIIGGIEVYVYGLSSIPAGAKDVAVLYLAHMRTRTYQVTEGMAHELLHRYRCASSSARGLIAITMDMRNHGAREVSSQANLTWKDGNENHALDLISLIDGSAHDFQLVIDLLPCYLPQFQSFHNIVMGISLGGHMTYRLAMRLRSGQVQGYVIVVGSPTLSSLLLGRLKVVAPGTPAESLDYLTPVELDAALNDTQRRRWPPYTLGKQVSAMDRDIRKGFPELPTLLCCGSVDPLVPPQFTESWLRRRKAEGHGDHARLFIQPNTGHSCTKEMIGLIANWILENVQ